MGADEQVTASLLRPPKGVAHHQMTLAAAAAAWVRETHSICCPLCGCVLMTALLGCCRQDIGKLVGVVAAPLHGLAAC